MYYQYLNKLSDNKMQQKGSQLVAATKTPKTSNKTQFGKDSLYSSKSPSYSPKTNKKETDVKFEYNESMLDEKNASYYELNKSRASTARNRSNGDNKQVNCYQQLMQRAYGRQSTHKPVVKEIPIPDKSKSFLNTQDSLYQIDHKVIIDLGDNPFSDTHKQTNAKPQCLTMSAEDETPISIKVFPNSTKNQLDKADKSKNAKKQPKKDNSYYYPNPIKSTLEEKLFDENLDVQKRSKSQQKHNIESTVLVDTEQIKRDYQNTSYTAMTPRNTSYTAMSPRNTSQTAMSPKCKPGSIHFKNETIHLKLTRNPDRHFYDFIKEYGVIVSVQSPLTTQNISPQSTSKHWLNSQRDVNLMISQLPTNTLSDEKKYPIPINPFSSNFDSSVFTQYFQNESVKQQFNSPQSVDKKKLQF